MSRRSKFCRFVFGSVLMMCCLFLVISHWQSDAGTTFSRMPEQTLIIDPGHGGEDGGAVSVSGQPESGINLSISRRMDQLMGFYGVNTVMTRESDVSIHDADAHTLRQKKVSDLHNRVALVNSIDNATLLSIHQNASLDGSVCGAHVFYADEILSRPLADKIQNMIRDTLDPDNDRAAQRVGTGVYLMNHISCRAVLVECGFLSHREEDCLLQSQDYQKKLAAILAACYLSEGDTQEGESLV